MPKRLSVSDLDGSFRILFVILTLVDGFLLAYGGGRQSDIMLIFYYGLNFLPITLLAVLWWTATFFDKIVWKLYSWFMLFNLIIQSFLLQFSTFFPTDWWYLVFPLTPIFAAPIEIVIYRRYRSIGQTIERSQITKTFWLCFTYSIVQFFWFMILYIWLVVMAFIELFKLLKELLTPIL